MKRGLRRCSITGLFLKFFQVEILPENITRWSAVDLEGEEAFEGGVLFVGVGEVGAEFSIEPGLKVVALALDDDGVPVVPFKELFSLCGEGCEFFFRCFVSVSREPSSTGFVKDARSPRAGGKGGEKERRGKGVSNCLSEKNQENDG